jgi:hypothetical protein
MLNFETHTTNEPQILEEPQNLKEHKISKETQIINEPQNYKEK